MYEAGALTDGRRTDYGFGWRLLRDEHNRRWVAHSGGAVGGATCLSHHPEHGVAVALLTNAEDVKGLEALAMRLGAMLLPPD